MCSSDLGSLGEMSEIALLIGFAYMLFRKIITWHIPVTILVTVAVFSINYPHLFILQEKDFNSHLKALTEKKKLEGLIIVSNKKRETVSALSGSLPIVHLVPKNLNLRIPGCPG